MNGQPIRPSRHWYWLAAGPGVVAVILILLAVVGFVSLTTQINSFPRVQVPGQGTLTFNGTGQYLLYFEGPGFGSSSPSSHGSVPLSLQSQATGQQIPITHMQGQSDFYNLGGHSGTAIGSVTIVTPGKYTLIAGQPTNPGLKDIAVGRAFVKSIIASVVELIFGVLAMIGGAVAAIVITVRRSTYRRRLLAGLQFMPPGRPYPAGGPMPYPGGGPMPYPGGGQAQYPAGGPAQYPGGGPAPYPAGGQAPYPAGGQAPYPGGGQAQYPAGGQPSPSAPEGSAYLPPPGPEQPPYGQPPAPPPPP